MFLYEYMPYHITCLRECRIDSIGDAHCQVVRLCVLPVEAAGQDHIAVLSVNTESVILVAIWNNNDDN